MPAASAADGEYNETAQGEVEALRAREDGEIEEG